MTGMRGAKAGAAARRRQVCTTLIYLEKIARTSTYEILYLLMAPPRTIHGYTSSILPESQNADDRPHIKYYHLPMEKQRK